MKRGDGRDFNELRPIIITPGIQSFAEGSALIELGKTRVLCTVSVEDRVPHFLRGQGKGWLTAEYAMLPRSTAVRTTRDVVTGHIAGRSQEIQRLIGRSLRAVIDLSRLGERTLTVDCDVLQADGGTRTAAITGAYVALYQAVKALCEMGIIEKSPLLCAIAATSVGVVGGKCLLDLCYDEDSGATVDFNVVKTEKGEYVEIQGTGEESTFSKETMDMLLAIADQGINALFEAQQAVLATLT